MQISAPRPASTSGLAAAVVALAHRDDFARLGASDVNADSTGIDATFATAAQGDVARAIVNEAFRPEVNGRTVLVPFRAQPAGSDRGSAPQIGVDDAKAAIERLGDVTRVAVLDAAATIFVGTLDAKAARRVDGLLRDSLLGYDVIVDVDGRKETRVVDA